MRTDKLRFISRKLISLAVLMPVVLLSNCSDQPDGPSIFLLTVDTTRADHFSYRGYARKTTPNIDQLAAESHVFTNAYSAASFTDPAFSTIMSGFLPHETKVFSNKHALPEGVETLAERLQQEGYVTGAVVSNFALRAQSGFAQGFDYYNDEMTDENKTNNLPERIGINTTEAALDWLKKNRRKKIFFWVHYQDPHGPYTPPAEYDGIFVNDGLAGQDMQISPSDVPEYQFLNGKTSLQYYIAQHDAEIKYFDSQLGRLISAIKKYGLYENSLIIFTSDHGESLSERAEKLYHGKDLYRELIHVPLLVRWKGIHETITTPVHHWDLFPTVLHLLGLEGPKTLRGKDLLSGSIRLQPLFSQTEEFLSLIVNNFHLIMNAREKTFEFYDFSRDPSEKKDESSDPARTSDMKHMKLLLYQIANQDFLNVKDAIKETDPIILERLATLGYVN